MYLLYIYIYIFCTQLQLNLSVFQVATHSPQENSAMRSAPTPADNSSSCLKSDTCASIYLFYIYKLTHREELFICCRGIQFTHRLHGSTGDDDRSALLKHLGKIDGWIQQQELDAALRQNA